MVNAVTMIIPSNVIEAVDKIREGSQVSRSHWVCQAIQRRLDIESPNLNKVPSDDDEVDVSP